MNLRTFDLNLLLVFDAVAEHRNVTRASASLGLSQSATSAALKRLRDQLGDPLFVKVGDAMQPTPRALELIEPVRSIIDTLRENVLQSLAFDPKRSDRRFTLLTPDIGEINFLPKLLCYLAAEAPSLKITTVSLPPYEAASALDTGDVDIALGYLPDLEKESYYRQRLFSNEFV